MFLIFFKGFSLFFFPWLWGVDFIYGTQSGQWDDLWPRPCCPCWVELQTQKSDWVSPPKPERFKQSRKITGCYIYCLFAELKYHLYLFFFNESKSYFILFIGCRTNHKLNTEFNTTCCWMNKSQLKVYLLDSPSAFHHSPLSSSADTSSCLNSIFWVMFFFFFSWNMSLCNGHKWDILEFFFF